MANRRTVESTVDGDPRHLADRLRDPDYVLTMRERIYLADLTDKPVGRPPKQETIDKKLHIAAWVIHTERKGVLNKEAVASAMKEFEVGKRTVQNAVAFYRGLLPAFPEQFILMPLSARGGSCERRSEKCNSCSALLHWRFSGC